MERYLWDRTRGRYVPRRVQKATDVSCGLERSCRFLLSAGLFTVVHISRLVDLVQLAGSTFKKYAKPQLWFANGLDLAIASRSISLRTRDSCEAKVAVRRGPIYTGCKWRQLRRLAKRHSPKCDTKHASKLMLTSASRQEAEARRSRR